MRPSVIGQWLRMMRNDLPGQVERSIRRHGLFRDGQPIVVAVSGGVDSMVLLRVLHELAGGHGWQLKVAHLNHRLRGRGSEADARLVRRAAAALGWPCVIGRAEVRSIARARGLSLEMAAREARHGFLAGVAAPLAWRTVALAHHADDQLELFFLRLLRGCGGEGLAGMKWRGPSPSDPRVTLVRPLLDQPKAALRQWAAARGVAFREDASNAHVDIQRNRIRHELLPLLRRHYQPALERTVARLMDILGEEAAFVAEKAREWIAEVSSAGAGGAAATAFAELPPAVQRRCIQLQLLAQGIEPDYELVEQLRAAPDRAVTVGQVGLAEAQAHEEEGGAARPVAPLPSPPEEGGEKSSAGGPDAVRVLRDGRGMVRLVRAEAARFRTEVLEQPLSERAGEVLFEGVRLGWRITPAGRKPRFGRAGREYFDAERVGTPVVLRHWRPGDRFQPSGMRVPVKLQDLFTNEKVLPGRRRELIVAATAQGELFWVEGLRISERFKLTRRTKRRLQWSWERLQNGALRLAGQRGSIPQPLVCDVRRQ